MNKKNEITPLFVDLIPGSPDEGILYISRKYSTAVHLCCCGCGLKVVTPLKSGQWSLEVLSDGRVSLSPSIGNWNFPCQSHYWIRNNVVDWSGAFSKAQIEAVRRSDRKAVEERFNQIPLTLWQRFVRWFAKLLGL